MIQSFVFSTALSAILIQLGRRHNGSGLESCAMRCLRAQLRQGKEGVQGTSGAREKLQAFGDITRTAVVLSEHQGLYIIEGFIAAGGRLLLLENIWSVL